MPTDANFFVGLPVHLESRTLEALHDAPHGVRLFAPTDVHVTVSFLGAVSEESARRAFELARGFPLAPCDATLEAVVPLGNPRRPSALSATLATGRDLVAEAMQTRRDAILAAAGREPDPRGVLPHVTLARVQRRATDAEHRAAIAWAKSLDIRGHPARIDRIALFTWSDDRRETLFKIVASEELGVFG